MTTVCIDPQGDGGYLLSGELTFTTVPDTWNHSGNLFAGVGPLVFDFAGITRSDSAALALLLEWIRVARRQGREIHYHNLPDQLLAVADVSGMKGILIS